MTASRHRYHEISCDFDTCSAAGEYLLERRETVVDLNGLGLTLDQTIGLRFTFYTNARNAQTRLYDDAMFDGVVRLGANGRYVAVAESAVYWRTDRDASLAIHSSAQQSVIIPEVIDAHRHSWRNRNELRESDPCGCCYCLARFDYKNIDDWVDDGNTAMCPGCGIDSVIGSASGYPITHEFLSAMRKHWF